MTTDWTPAHGELVRYGNGSTALVLRGDPHAGGWHGTQCMGGTVFFHDGWDRSIRKPTPEDRAMWVRCAMRYRGKTREEAEVEAGLRESPPAPEVAGLNGVVGCLAERRGGFAVTAHCPRGCMNDAHGCRARADRHRQGLPPGPVFQHDEALLDTMIAEWPTRVPAISAQQGMRDIAKSYCLQMRRRGAVFTPAPAPPGPQAFVDRIEAGFGPEENH